MSSLRETLNDLLSITVDEQIERIAHMAVVGFANQRLAPEAAELVWRVLDALPPSPAEVGSVVLWNGAPTEPNVFLIGTVIKTRLARIDGALRHQCYIQTGDSVPMWWPAASLYVIK